MTGMGAERARIQGYRITTWGRVSLQPSAGQHPFDFIHTWKLALPYGILLRYTNIVLCQFLPSRPGRTSVDPQTSADPVHLATAESSDPSCRAASLPASTFDLHG
jgi:hypothetical protein